MDILLYSFGKNENSTKMPVTDGFRLSGCELKQPTSVLTPVLLLSKVENVYQYNYVYIIPFKRYYYITDYIYYGNIWHIKCNVDVLSSYRTVIGSSSQYVLRSAYASDGSILDVKYPSTTDIQVIVSGIEDDPAMPEPSLPTATPPDGYYVVGIISPEFSAIGPTAYYLMNNNEFRTFCNAMLSNADWVSSGITEIGADLTKILFNPFQYITSAKWFPFSFSAGQSTELTFGWWKLPVNARPLTVTNRLISFTLSIPKHPQSSTRGIYLNANPFSRYTLYWPLVGQIPLDPAKLINTDRLICQCYVDAISGGSVFTILTPDGSSVYTTQMTMGVNIQLGQVATDYLGSVVEMVDTVGNAITGNFIGALSGIGNVAKSMFPSVSVHGNNGMTVTHRFGAYLQAEFYTVVPEDNEHCGRPLCQKRRLDTLYGYMEVDNPELEIAGTVDELTSIKAYLKNGFYFE